MNAMRICDLTNSGPVNPLRLTVWMNERRRRRKREESHEQATDSAWVWRMSRLTRDETAEPVSSEQTLRRKRGQDVKYFPFQLTTGRIDNFVTRLIQILLYLVVSDNHIIAKQKAKIIEKTVFVERVASTCNYVGILTLLPLL